MWLVSCSFSWIGSDFKYLQTSEEFISFFIIIPLISIIISWAIVVMLKNFI